MPSTGLSTRNGLIAAAILALLLGACDSTNDVAADADGPSETIKAILEAPQQSGAHRQRDPHASLDAEQLARVALRHLDEGRGQLALDTLNQALAKFAHDGILLSVRASLYLQNQQTSLALADLNRALEIDPHDPVLLSNRAQAYRQFGRVDEARRDLDSAIELDPAFIAAYFNRGSLHFEAEKYDLALHDFNRCIELEPEVPAAYFNRASTREALGDRTNAILDLEQFLALSPQPGWIPIAEDLLQQWQSDRS